MHCYNFIPFAHYSWQRMEHNYLEEDYEQSILQFHVIIIILPHICVYIFIITEVVKCIHGMATWGHASSTAATVE